MAINEVVEIILISTLAIGYFIYSLNKIYGIILDELTDSFV